MLAERGLCYHRLGNAVVRLRCLVVGLGDYRRSLGHDLVFVVYSGFHVCCDCCGLGMCGYGGVIVVEEVGAGVGDNTLQQ